MAAACLRPARVMVVPAGPARRPLPGRHRHRQQLQRFPVAGRRRKQYQSPQRSRVWRTTPVVLDPLEWIHRITPPIPGQESHCQRFYGAYSNRGRILRAPARADNSASGIPAGERDNSDLSREARSTWARLVRKIFEADPRTCGACGSRMRIPFLSADPRGVDRILRHRQSERCRTEGPFESRAPPLSPRTLQYGPIDDPKRRPLTPSGRGVPRLMIGYARAPAFCASRHTRFVTPHIPQPPSSQQRYGVRGPPRSVAFRLTGRFARISHQVLVIAASRLKSYAAPVRSPTATVYIGVFSLARRA